MRFESTLECDYLTTLAFDPLLVDVLEQPIRIEYRDENGRLRRYTPDFLVRWRPPALPHLVEIKYRNDLRENWAILKPKFRAAIRFAADHGLRFRIVTDATVRKPVNIDTLRFLHGYLRREPAPKIEQLLLDTLVRLGEAAVNDLIAATFPSADDQLAAIGPLWRLVATGAIHVDRTKPINMASRLRSQDATR